MKWSCHTKNSLNNILFYLNKVYIVLLFLNVTTIFFIFYLVIVANKNIDNDTKEMIWQTLNALFKIAKNNIFEELPRLPEKSKENKI